MAPPPSEWSRACTGIDATCYGILEDAMTWQMAPGNGVQNLTGAEQVIHEFSIGMGHCIAWGMKLEGRVEGPLMRALMRTQTTLT